MCVVVAQDSDCCMCCSRNCEILGAQLKAHGFCIPAQSGESGGFWWAFSCVVASFCLGYLLRGVAAHPSTRFPCPVNSNDHTPCFALCASRHPAETLLDVLEEADEEVQSYVRKAQSACISKVFKLWPWSQMISGRQRYFTIRHRSSRYVTMCQVKQQLPQATAEVRCGGYRFWSCQRISSKRCQLAVGSCKMLQGCVLYFPVCHMQSKQPFLALLFFCCFTQVPLDHVTMLQLTAEDRGQPGWKSVPRMPKFGTSWKLIEPSIARYCQPIPVCTCFQHGTCSLKSEARANDITYFCILSMWNAKLLQAKSGIVPTHLWVIVHLDPYLAEGMHGDVIKTQGNWRDFLPSPASADCADVYDCPGRRVLSWASRRILGTGPGDGIGPTLSPASWWQALLVL